MRAAQLLPIFCVHSSNDLFRPYYWFHILYLGWLTICYRHFGRDLSHKKIADGSSETVLFLETQLANAVPIWKAFWMRDFRLPPRSGRELRSSGLLRNVYDNYYRRVGTTYRSHLQGSRIQELLTLENGTDRLYRNIGKELPLHAA